MHINIGSLQEPQDIVDLLLECHERIRSFAGVARRIAETTSASADEIRDAAARVSRYFSEALPLHVADEEQSIIPRLAGKNADVDAALARMHGEHQEHEQKLKVVVETCNTLKKSPRMLDDLRDRLRDAATALETESPETLTSARHRPNP